VYCSECGGLTSTEAAFCPHCGTPSDAGLASRSRSGDDGTLVVDGSDSESWATISEAIRNARPHDRILVRPGVYRETLTIDLPLEIAGDGPAKDVVILSGDRCAVEMRTEQATLRGLTLRCSAPGSPVERYCVDVTHGQLVLEDCDIASAATACVNVRGRVASALMRKTVNSTRSRILG
jgi:hypothetical protein